MTAPTANRQRALIDERRVALAAGAAMAAICVSQLGVSLWTDEGITAWIIDDDLAAVWRRGSEFQGMGPAYFAILWAWSKLAGTSELALRLPSLLAMAAAAVLVYRTGRDLRDATAGWIATTVFVVLPVVYFHAIWARPYAFELLLLLVSSRALLAWLDGGGTGTAMRWTVAGTAALYFQPFAVFALAAHVVPLRRAASTARLRTDQLAVALGTAVVLAVPLVPQLLRYAGRTDLLSFSPMPSLLDLVKVLFPAMVVGPILVAAFVAGVPRGRERHVDFLVAWAVAPPLLTFLFSQLTGDSIWQDRYYLSFAPGFALLAGVLLRRVTSATVRSAALAALAVIAISTLGQFTGPRDDFRGALAAARAAVEGNDGVLVVGQVLTESQSPDYFDDAESRTYLTAVTQYYDPGAAVVPMPFSLANGGEEYVDAAVETEMLGRDVVVVLDMLGKHEVDYPEVFHDRLVAAGFEHRPRQSFQSMTIDVYERAGG